MSNETAIDKKRVAIVIPAYNEAAVINKVVSDLIKSLNRQKKFNFEVILVNDGSADKTAEQAEAGGANVISHLMNVGAGGATATGLKYAHRQGFDMAATLDADGQHLPTDIVKGIKIMLGSDGLDLLIGSRLIDAEGMSKTKILGNKGLSTITRLVFGVKVTDSQSGLRVFSKKALENLRWRTSGYEFCSEMLWRAQQQGMSIKEYPIKAVYSEYSKAKGQSNWNAINILKALLRRRIMELFNE